MVHKIQMICMIVTFYTFYHKRFLFIYRAFETIIDSCMNFVMPGSRCDKSVMLSALSNITVIANQLPQDFDIRSCSGKSSTVYKTELSLISW